jgi:hypothetical protein
MMPSYQKIESLCDEQDLKTFRQQIFPLWDDKFKAYIHAKRMKKSKPRAHKKFTAILTCLMSHPIKKFY